MSTRDIASHISSQLSELDDDQNATVVRDRGSLSDADTATRLPADDEMPTIGRPSNAPMALTMGLGPAGPITARERRACTGGSWSLRGRAPVRAGSTSRRRRSFGARIIWLEEEARRDHRRHRAWTRLLAVSELCRLVGDTERALPCVGGA